MTCSPPPVSPKIDTAWYAAEDDPTKQLTQPQLLNLKKYLIKHRDFVDADGEILLLDRVPEAVFRALDMEGGVCKTVACDTLAVWFSRATQLAGTGKSYASQLGKFVDQARADSLFDYVLDTWTDSGSALGSALREMFVKLLAFLAATKDQKFRTQLLQKWMLHSLEIPNSMRVLYFLVEQLSREPGMPEFILQKRPSFIRDSLEYIWSGSLCANIGKAIFMILRKTRESCESDSEWLAMWSDDVLASLKDPRLQQGIDTYLLPQLFQVSKEATREFVARVVSDGDVKILLGCLTVAQSSSVILEPFEGPDAIMALEKVESLLTQDSEYFKVTAFSLLVTSPKRSSPIKPYLYELIESCFDALFSEMNVDTRNKMFGMLQKFIWRIRDSTHRMQRDLAKMEEKDPARFKAQIDAYKADILKGKTFLEKLLDFSLFNLKPGSSHQRKSFAFLVLLGLIHSGLDSRVEEQHHDKYKVVKYPFHLEIYTPYLLRVMVDNICDNYQDNRTSALSVLSISPIELAPQDLTLASSRAIDLVSDMKGKSVDAGARFFQFLFQYYSKKDREKCHDIIDRLQELLEQMLELAREDLASACFESNVQGFFAAFKLILEVIDFADFDPVFTTELLSRLVAQAHDAWEISREVLQHDSPEGNLGEEIESNYDEDLEAKYGKGTQVILSYTWRALKESSEMLDVAIRRAPLSDEQVEDCGSLLIDQLGSIRHKGAFSSANPTYVSCCLRCQKSPTLRHLNKQWLEENIALITQNSNFITRRSAGIPYLINGPLNADNTLIGPTIERLLAIARQPADPDQSLEDVSLPQVNAFNCIKAIFIDKSLAEKSVEYVDVSMQLALESFESPIWAIRNCAVMLFTALENRMFSAKKLRNNVLATYPAKLFFTKFPSVKHTFLHNLEEAVRSGLDDVRQVERIFPILTIMGRLDPTPNYTALDDFKPLHLQCLKSRQWKVREMAARSLPALLSSNEALQKELEDRFTEIDPKSRDFNTAHGALLAAQELLTRLRRGFFGWSVESANEKTDGITEQLKRIILAKAEDVLSIPCYPVVLEYFKLVGQFEELGDYTTLYDWLMEELAQKSPSLNGGRQLALREAALVLLKQTLSSKSFAALFTSCVSSSLDEVQLAVVDFCQQNQSSLSISERSLALSGLWSLVSRPVWTNVKARALSLLNELLGDATESCGDQLDLLVSLSSDSNKFLRLAAIEALGPIVARNRNSYAKWFAKVEALVDDDLEYPERKTALKSLVGFNRVWFHPEATESFQVVGLLFRFLSDDDSELRDLASEHLSAVVLGLDFALVPAVAENKMVEWIVRDIKSHPTFGSLVSHFFSPSSSFKDLFSQDTLLFSYEKQNLYRDEINRADQLNRILRAAGIHSKDFVSTISINVAQINRWILQTKPVDGCFGWSLDEDKMTFLYENLQGLATSVELGDIAKDSQIVKDTHRAFSNESLKIHPLLVRIVDGIL